MTLPTPRLAAAAAGLTLLLTGATAHATSSRADTYAGTTAQGAPVSIVVKQSARGTSLVVHRVRVHATLTCHDGGADRTVRHSRTPASKPHLSADGSFVVADGDLQVEGRLRAGKRRISGTVTVLDGMCVADDVPFTAHRS